jgi:hypothetical protein
MWWVAAATRGRRGGCGARPIRPLGGAVSDPARGSQPPDSKSQRRNASAVACNAERSGVPRSAFRERLRTARPATATRAYPGFCRARIRSSSRSARELTVTSRIARPARTSQRLRHHRRALATYQPSPRHVNSRKILNSIASAALSGSCPCGSPRMKWCLASNNARAGAMPSCTARQKAVCNGAPK